MTAVWSLIVACLVAFGGVGRVEARVEPAVTTVTSARAVVAVVHGVAARPASHIAAPARGLERRLPLAIVPAAFSLRTPSLRAQVLPRLAVRDAAVRVVTTGSARGPPIA